jgi:hypothetical protein
MQPRTGAAAGEGRGRRLLGSPHTVTGRALNSIELHPILDFACLSG